MTDQQPSERPVEADWSAPPPAQPVVTPPPGPALVYAPWRRRVFAFLLDGVIILIAGVVCESVFRTRGAAPVGELIALVLLQWMQSRTGSTMGKSAFGLRLLDASDGTPPMFATCICRWLLHVVDAVLLLGFLAPIVTPRHQTFADMIAKTVVVIG